jgi:tetratricopeptide (TPR) repeat protein
MPHDAQGLELTTASAAAAAAWDHTIAGYLGYRADTARHLAATLAAAPDFGLAHCLAGYFALLGFNTALLPAAREAAGRARPLLAAATPREQAHLAALEAWLAAAPDRAVAIWDGILAGHPRDVLAFRLAHFVNFWLGRPDRMRASVLAVEPHWDPDVPAYPTLLACRCFAFEECGLYTEAEAAGREAIARDPGDLWAAHGVAHVLEMQGRRAEGIDWITRLAPGWEGANNLRHHLHWHAAMFHFERGAFDQVLALYDTAFRNLAAPLTLALPDLYIDIQNAVSMLYRLARQGIDVGSRWDELADKAEARVGDCLSPFTLPHWAMALAATRRWAAAERLLGALRRCAAGNDTIAAQVREAALPVSEAVIAAGRGDPARAVALMRPALGAMSGLGGSHAQQDVLEQVFLDAAMAAGAAEDAILLLERVAGRHQVPPHRRRGYADAAAAVAWGR